MLYFVSHGQVFCPQHHQDLQWARRVQSIITALLMAGQLGGATVKVPRGNRGSHGLHLYTSSLLSLFGVFTVVRLRGKGDATLLMS